MKPTDLCVNDLQDVIFRSLYLQVDYEIFSKTSELYLFPTYSEGMPTSVLEAMAFGLPVITRPVGGLKDFFENGEMGYMLESLDPEVYVHHIETLIKDVKLTKRISDYNYRFIKEHSLASKIAKNLEDILKSI